MTDPDLTTAVAARLRSLAERISRRSPMATRQVDFELRWLSDPALLDEIGRDVSSNCPRGTPALYQFRATEPKIYGALAAAFRDRPLEHPETGKTLSYSRLMAPSHSEALYVGSGRDLPARTGQHLGRIGGAGTYAMRLALWALDVPARIEFSYWPYPADVDAVELELLEQELWDIRTPLLGKRSGR